MHALDHIRWHLLLALLGALLMHWLPWQTAAIAVGVITLERGVQSGFVRARQRSITVANDHHSETPVEDAGKTQAPGSITSRLPLDLVRLFGAECALCAGLGCRDCAHTGLR